MVVQLTETRPSWAFLNAEKENKGSKMATVKRNNTSGAIQLSPHFYLSEFAMSNTATRAGIDNTPDPLAVANLFKLAELMEKIRTLLGNKAVVISSGFRGVRLNTLIGGARTSEHMTGEACDFSCNGYGTPLQVCEAIVKSGIKFGQLIQEGNWTHISLHTDAHCNEVMTAHFDSSGSVTYSGGI
jgi:zinc D-Ala-D-Ala carboxypeptidase